MIFVHSDAFFIGNGENEAKIALVGPSCSYNSYSLLSSSSAYCKDTVFSLLGAPVTSIYKVITKWAFIVYSKREKDGNLIQA